MALGWGGHVRDLLRTQTQSQSADSDSTYTQAIDKPGT